MTRPILRAYMWRSVRNANGWTKARMLDEIRRRGSIAAIYADLPPRGYVITAAVAHDQPPPPYVKPPYAGQSEPPRSIAP